MKKILTLLVLFVMTFVGIMVVYHWDLVSTGRFMPPNITIENCEDIIKEIKKYDWDAEIAVGIMKAESKCDAEAKGDTELVFTEKGREYGYSVGAFQIRILPGREKCDTFDVATNVKCAYDIYKENKSDWSAWSMYNNEKYKDYMWHTIW